MADEIQFEGLAVAPEVLQTIVIVAASEVEGVASVETGQTLAGLAKKSGGKASLVSIGEDGTLAVVLHLKLAYGQPLHETGKRVQRAVADALSSMSGQPVASVDVFVDGVVFPG